MNPVRIILGLACVACFFVLGASLVGCANSTSPQQLQTNFVQACSAYNGALGAAVQLRQAGKLSQAQIDQVTALDNQITPICTGPLPSDPTVATTTITAAVTTLGAVEATMAINKGAK